MIKIKDTKKAADTVKRDKRMKPGQVFRFKKGQGFSSDIYRMYLYGNEFLDLDGFTPGFITDWSHLQSLYPNLQIEFVTLIAEVVKDDM